MLACGPQANWPKLLCIPAFSASFLPGGALGAYTIASGFYLGCGDLNSGPHTYTVSTFTHSPSPQLHTEVVKWSLSWLYQAVIGMYHL